MTYDELVATTVAYSQPSSYLCLAILGELGELANVLKKELRNQENRTYDLVDELGDVCWYLVAFAHEGGHAAGQVFDPGYELTERSSLRRVMRSLITKGIDLDAAMEANPGDFKHSFGIVTDMGLLLLQFMKMRGIELETVLEFNIQKLQERQQSGTIKHHD